MHIIRIVHLLYEATRDVPICVQRLWAHLYGNVSQQAVQIPIAVVPKCSLCQSCDFGLCTAMRIIGTVHLLYEMPLDLPICVKS